MSQFAVASCNRSRKARTIRKALRVDSVSRDGPDVDIVPAVDAIILQDPDTAIL